MGIIARAPSIQKKEKEEKGKGGGQTSIYAPSDKEITKKKERRRERGGKKKTSLPHETLDVYPVSHPVCPNPTVHLTLPMMTTINANPPSTLTPA